MNTAEEFALRALLEADTPERWRKALYGFGARGVRLTDSTRSVVTEMASRMNARDLRQLAPHPGDALSKRIAPGPEPELGAAARAEIAEWLRCWRHRDALIADGTPPGALLLHGPTGTGKTMTTAWLAGELAEHMPTFVLDAHEWVRSHLGESAQNLARIFGALAGRSGALVLEEIDSVATTRSTDPSEGASEITRVTIALMRLIEQAAHPIIATTNRLGALDVALVRRFQAVVELPQPSVEIRQRVVARILRDAVASVDTAQPIACVVRDAQRARQRWVLDRAAETEAAP